LLLSGVVPAQGTTTLVSQTPSGTAGNGSSAYPSLSDDGSVIAFHSNADNLVSGDSNLQPDVFVRYLATGTTMRASSSSTGGPVNGASVFPRISGNGRFVAFQSNANNLAPPDANGRWDVYVVDLQTGVNVRASDGPPGIQGNQDSTNACLTQDGRFVAFGSLASNLVPNDTNGASDVFVRDLVTNTTVLASSTSNGVVGNLASKLPWVDGDGRYVAFESLANNLVAGDTNGVSDVFVKDLLTGEVLLASIGLGGQPSNGGSFAPSLSRDGRFVEFESSGTNLVPGDTNARPDMFVRDLRLGVTVRVSVAANGTEANDMSGGNGFLALAESPCTADGRFAVFLSYATNLSPGDGDVWWDVYRKDLWTGTMIRASLGANSQEIDGNCLTPSVSANGQRIAFITDDNTAVPGDTNMFADVLLRDLGTPTFDVLCVGNNPQAPCPCANSGAAGHGCENSRGTGGAVLSASGLPSTTADSLVLHSTGEGPGALTLLLQGNQLEPPTFLADGLRCTGGFLRRLYSARANAGAIDFPALGAPSLSARSAASGDVLLIGVTRCYQTYYRDGSASFCPTGGTANLSNAIAVVWSL